MRNAQISVLNNNLDSTTVNSISQRLALLPSFIQRVLQVAACIGEEIDETAISIAIDDAKDLDIDESLKVAATEGYLVFERQKSRYRFAPTIRHSVLATLDDDQQVELSFRIGQRLWTRSSPMFLSSNVFMVANLLNCGVGIITTSKADRYRAARLNLEAGVKAASLAKFPRSARYLRTGIEILREGKFDYWTGDYELSLELFSTAADTELCNQNFDCVIELVQEIFEHAKSLKDKLSAHLLLINCMGQIGQTQEAIRIGADVLRQLGEPLAEKTCPFTIKMEAIKTKMALKRCSDSSLLRLAPMQDEEKLAAMQIMATLLPFTLQGDSKLHSGLISTKLVRMLLKYGFHKSCTLGIASFGLMLCESDRKESYRLGSLALSIVERSRAKELIPRVQMIFYGFMSHWRRPLRSSLAPLGQVIRVGIEIGDFEYAMMAQMLSCAVSLFIGTPLACVEEMLLEAIRQMQLYRQEVMVQVALTFLQYIHNLTGRAKNVKLLVGDALQQPCDAQAVAAPQVVQYYQNMFGANLAFMFGDHDLAERIVQQRKALAYIPKGQYMTSLEQFQATLIAVAQVRLGQSPRTNLKKAKQGLTKLRIWSKDCPENFLHKQQLVEAELRSLSHHCHGGGSVNQRILDLYGLAKRNALKQGFLHEAALACELAGDYLRRQGDLVLGHQYGAEARRLYLEWGATEKVKHHFHNCAKEL